MHSQAQRTLRIALATLFALLLGFTPRAQASGVLHDGAGRFVFQDAASHTGKQLRVWYYKPQSLKSDSRILFVMHGANRNADNYRDNWQAYAEKYNFLLLAPEFSEPRFSDAEYNFGNIQDPDPHRWTYSIIENIFDDVRKKESLTATHYDIYGHSAGAQFVHRFMLFMRAPRVNTAIAANAGTYTMPIYPNLQQDQFPWALDVDVISKAQLQTAFARKLVIMLGEKDIDPNHPQLSKKPPAMAQGAYRYARGQNFFRAAQAEANAMQTPFTWQMINVPGVAHSDRGMAKSAVVYLYEAKP